MITVPKTFYSLQAVGRMLKVPPDTIKDAFKGKSLESIGAIKPIAHLFHKFEEGDEFSYAILKSHFDRWQRTGKVPRVSTGRPVKYTDLNKYTYINFPILNEIYEPFKEIVDNANAMSIAQISYRDQISVALEEYVQRRPHLMTQNMN